MDDLELRAKRSGDGSFVRLAYNSTVEAVEVTTSYMRDDGCDNIKQSQHSVVASKIPLRTR